MSFSAIGNLSLGSLLQIAYSEGFRSQMPLHFKDWSYILQKKIDDPNMRQYQYLLHTSMGLGAIAERNPNGSTTFPSGVKSGVAEATAYLKEMNATIEYEQNLFEMAKKGNNKYADVLSTEVQDKLNGSKMVAASRLYADGTGVLGTAASVSDAGIGSGYIVVTLNATSTTRGHARLFLDGDHVICKQSDGSARAPTGGSSFSCYRVKERNASTPSVTLELISSAGVVLTSYSASAVAAGDVFYRAGQPTFPDLTGTIADYGTITECMVGLESLTANDGRTVNGVALSGVKAGTRVDVGAAVIEADDFHGLMDELKLNVGYGIMNWKMGISAPEVIRALVTDGDNDRRFAVKDDVRKGSRVWTFQHEDDTIELQPSPFCPKTRVVVLPEEKSGEKVLAYVGTDFYPFKTENGQEEFPKPSSSGGYERALQRFLQQYGNLACFKPNAIGVLHNFTLS